MTDRAAINRLEAEARQSLVAIAQAMLAGDLSFFEGAVQVLRLKVAVGGVADRDPDFDAFALIESETDHLPLKAQHLLWDPEALAKLGPEFQRTEAWAASFAPAACRSLVGRFGGTAAKTANPALQPTVSGRD